jgi:hypothetical protein
MALVMCGTRCGFFSRNAAIDAAVIIGVATPVGLIVLTRMECAASSLA